MAVVGRFENVVSACIHRPWDDLEGANLSLKGEANEHERGKTAEGSTAE
jgi:hypothetical protein